MPCEKKSAIDCGAVFNVGLMLDVRLLREEPERARAAIARKGLNGDVDAALALDGDRRTRLAEVEALRARQKAANQEMARLPKGSPEFRTKVGELKTLSGEVKEKEAVLKEVEGRWREAMLGLPNIPHESVPDGLKPEDNRVAATWGNPADVSADAKPHWDIPGFARLFDFERGVKVTGAGFPFFVGDGARLVRSLVQFFLEEAADAGYVEIAPPIFVNAASAMATGQLPDKEGQMYETVQDSLFAIPTAEVPVTNFFRDEILEEASLPIYRCAYTPCFRREAGSWGREVRGLNRVHQFDKVELLKWTHPDASYDELEKLREDAERLLRKLDLPFRALLMCAGDTGFAQAKKYDLEVWAGGQKRWLEVSSCSNFESFQARRAGIRYRSSVTGKPELVHTLNGSGLAAPRVLAAILENNVRSDGTVTVPEVLRRWLGKDVIRFER